MTKHEIGTKVRILPRAFVGGTSKDVGDVVKVAKYFGDEYEVFFDEEHNSWCWNEVEKVNTFTKDMLKDWMVVQYRDKYVTDGNFAVVNTKTERFITQNGYMPFQRYTNDLFNTSGDPRWEIIAVYEPGDLYKFDQYKHGKLIWKREEKSPEQVKAESIRKQMEQLSAELKELEDKL